MMIGYAMLGSNDIARAAAFYDAVLGVVGIGRLMEFPRGPAYGLAWDKPLLAITTPFDEGPATVGNGSMLALVMDARDKVDAVYARAIALGAKSEGAPGLRGPAEQNFHAAYFRDLDGNKLCVYTTQPR
jgi:catechol 2,3-dioxygenase-like lactoylglutathione lyase family enzyme